MNGLNWGRKSLPVIRQTESAECGLACLVMVATWHGLHTDLSEMRNHFSISIHGMTLHQLMEYASEMNLSGRAVRLETEDLKSLRLPCILHWDLNHFVVLNKVKRGKLILHDPEKGRITLPLRDAGKHFTGIALELEPTPAFTPRDERKKLRLRHLTGRTAGLIPALTRIMIFAVAVEILALGSPLLSQAVIDDVLVSADRNFLIIIIIALFLLSVTQMLLSLARQWAVITLSVNFNMQWTANVFHHLVRLPLGWFDARSKGSISARFGAIDTIQEALTTELLEGMLDVLLVVTSFCMMLLYSPALTLIAVLAAVFYILLRGLWYPSLRQAAEDAWDAETRESGHFLETLSGILSLRVNGVISHREAAWMNLNATRRNTQLRQSRLLMYYDVIHTLTGSLVAAAVLWKGTVEVLDGTFTVGMLVAYLSFQGRFSASINSLTDKFFSWRMLDIYNERLADIVMAPAEGQVPPSEHLPGGNILPKVPYFFHGGENLKESTCPLSLEGVTFTHRGCKTPLLRNISLTLNQNEVVAITGRSGCGKTTLAKLILAIHTPDEGVISAFGIRHTHAGYLRVRQRIGTVLQEDHLFSGSIADNIIFFSERQDYERMQHCASLAQVDTDITAMPMGYQTITGETGGGLSGGQKQRILLARALYKGPGFLLLDEATSHLDVESEIEISRILRQLGLPILLIAHRPETIASADRVLYLENGSLTELSRKTDTGKL